MKSAQLSLIAGLAVAAVAVAAPQENTGNLGPVNSNGPLNNAVNGIANFNAVGGYTLKSVYYSGSLTAVNTATYGSEARILVTPPGGNPTATLGPFWSTLTFAGALTMSGSYSTGGGYNPAGAWTFRCYETFDDGGTSSVDAIWNPLNFIFDDAPLPPPPPPPILEDLGTLPHNALVTRNFNLTTAGVYWYKFTTDVVIQSSDGSWLDIDTVGSTIAGGAFPNDTYIGVYAQAGTQRSIDDDDGPDFTSQVTYGTGTRPANGNGLPYDGRDGTLSNDTYYLACTAYPATWGATGFSVTSTHGHTGNYVININNGGLPPDCQADWNGDGQVDFFDYLDFVQDFSEENADFNGDGQTDFFDYLDFAQAFSDGCD